MSSKIDFRQLAALVKSKRGAKGLREAAEEIGEISPSTLSRIEGQRANDISMSTFLQLCDWLEISPTKLILEPTQNLSADIDVPDSISIELQLRTAKDIDPKTARMLAEMFKAAVRESQRSKGEENTASG